MLFVVGISCILKLFEEEECAHAYRHTHPRPRRWALLWRALSGIWGVFTTVVWQWLSKPRMCIWRSVLAWMFRGSMASVEIRARCTGTQHPLLHLTPSISPHLRRRHSTGKCTYFPAANRQMKTPRAEMVEAFLAPSFPLRSSPDRCVVSPLLVRVREAGLSLFAAQSTVLSPSPLSWCHLNICSLRIATNQTTAAYHFLKSHAG